MRGAWSGRRNLMALPIRFWKSCVNCVASPDTVGQRVVRDHGAALRDGRLEVAPARLRSSSSQSTGANGLPRVPTRE